MKPQPKRHGWLTPQQNRLSNCFFFIDRDSIAQRFLFAATVLCCSLVFSQRSAMSAELAGIQSSENFVLSAPSKELSQAGLERAELFRKQIALEWIGQELPAGESFADITISLAAAGEQDSGRLWLANRDSGRPHMMWLTGSREAVLGPGMIHEVAHVVMAGHFPSGMPVWANEGIASSYDDAERTRIRAEIMREIVATSAWPAIDEVLSAKQLAPSDQEGYALAASLTSFFVSQDSRPTFIRFVTQAQRAGWDAALKQVYNIANRSELEYRWHRWASAGGNGAVARLASGKRSALLDEPAVEPNSARTTH